MALLLGASFSIGPLLAGPTEASRGLTVQVYNWAAMRSQESSALQHFNPPAGTPDAAEPSPKFTVFVYNYAALPAEVLKQTEAEAARIYRHEGIEVEWLDCPLSPGEASQFPACQIHSGPTRLAVRLLSQSMTERLRPAQESFGFALYPDDGSFATVANVFAHDAKQLANRRGMQQGVILGHLIVHEVGHLLLGAGSHSAVGIMHVPWHLKELEIIGQGTMTFTPAQAERMRTNIRVRMAAEEPAGAAVPGNTALPELQSSRAATVKEWLPVSQSLFGSGHAGLGISRAVRPRIYPILVENFRCDATALSHVLTCHGTQVAPAASSHWLPLHSTNQS